MFIYFQKLQYSLRGFHLHSILAVHIKTTVQCSHNFTFCTFLVAFSNYLQCVLRFIIWIWVRSWENIKLFIVDFEYDWTCCICYCFAVFLWVLILYFSVFHPLRGSGYNKAWISSTSFLYRVDCGFEHMSVQTKDYGIHIYCFSAKHTALRRKSKDWLPRNQDNVSEWIDIATIGPLFQCNIIQIQLSMLV